MYLIYGGQEFYPRGPLGDFLDNISDKEKALSFAHDQLGKRAITVKENQDQCIFEEGFDIEWVKVIDGNTGKEVASFGKDPFGNEHPQAIEIVSVSESNSSKLGSKLKTLKDWTQDLDPSKVNQN